MQSQRIARLLALALAFCGANFLTCNGDEVVRALIVDGQNNHVFWPKTTAMMKSYLEDSGRFSVDVYRTKFVWNGGEFLSQFPLADGKEYVTVKAAKPDPNFKPEFANYDVVISNFGFNAADWPKETQTALEEYIQAGGGLVVVHAADNAFGDWPEFNRMIGLGGWGGRNEDSGPYVYLDDDGKLVRDKSKGNGGSHGEQHEFEVIVRNPDHPITNGMPRSWLHTKDELYDRLRGPAENMTILATAYADQSKGGSGRHEPMLMTIDYGKGRIFHSPMGHADYSMQCAGFVTCLLRGTEWAATGNVTIEIPEDFPDADKVSRREFATAQ